MFHVRIEESVMGLVTKRVDVLEMTTNKLHELLGRFMLKYAFNEDSFDENGYKEVEYKGFNNTRQAIKATVSFWRYSKANTKEQSILEKEFPITKHDKVPARVIQPPKVEEPKEERIQEMCDEGVLNTKAY